MIAHRAKHAWLQVAEGHIIRKTADIQFGIAMTVRIAANDKHMVSAVASHVGQRHGLIVKQQVRDRPGHALLKRGRTARTIRYRLGPDATGADDQAGHAPSLCARPRWYFINHKSS